MHDSGSTLSRLMLLKALGVRVAIDDFGTGYSSSPTCDSSHRRLEDRPFVRVRYRRFEGIGGARTYSGAAGQGARIETIAEGVETNDQRSRLETEHVDTDRASCSARPLAVADLDRLLLIPPESLSG